MALPVFKTGLSMQVDRWVQLPPSPAILYGLPSPPLMESDMIKSLPIVPPNSAQRRHPSWIKARIPGGGNYAELKKLMRDLDLHTVCEEARCPNIGECWNSRTATFMILGDICTRRCMFCAVKKGKPGGIVDIDEPRRLGEAVAHLKLNHVVITSVNRDDLPDGGAGVFADCITAARKHRPNCTIEVLIPDFEGNWKALEVIVKAEPEVLNHNTETVQRLYRRARPYANYQQTLTLLKIGKKLNPEMLTKSGLMVGLGETVIELLETMQDIQNTGCDILTIGQYLSPSSRHLPIQRYYTPEEFAELKEAGIEMGFRHVESGPLVRSSYHAGEQVQLSSLL